MVFHDRPVYQEEHAAQLIMARRPDPPPKGRIHLRRSVDSDLRFSLAFPRRTIHFKELHPSRRYEAFSMSALACSDQLRNRSYRIADFSSSSILNSKHRDKNA